MPDSSSPARPLRRALLWFAAALVVGYLIVPQLATAGRSLDLLARLDPLLVALGVALQAGAVVAQTQLTRSMLPRDERPGLGDMARIEVAATAAAHTVPGGTAAGTALGYRLLRRADVPADDAAFAVGARGLGSALVLNALLWLALVGSIPARGFHPLYATAAGLAVALLAAFGSIVLLLARQHTTVSERVRRAARHIPMVSEDKVANTVRDIAGRAREVAGRPRLFAVAVGWSGAYWLASAAALWVFVAAFGHRPALVSLLVAFALANVVAFVPVTPHGLAVVEATLIPLLVWLGSPRGPATLGVLGWRLIAFWLPIPLGVVAYLSLRVAPASSDAAAGRRRDWRDRLRGLADDLFSAQPTRRSSTR